MKITLLKSLMLFGAFFCFLTAQAQTVTVSGTISDANGPLPGATIVCVGTTNGTQTDFDGNFTLNNVAENATLLISYLGYTSQRISLNGQSSINITLAEDAQALDEVVVTGYGSQTRGDLTGSVATVDVSDAAKQPLVNAAEALEGRVTGVSVVNNGAPGSTPIVRIRGFGTPNNNNPLYIIDGAQTTDASILNTINPQDIAQFNVLKDGAASIYGARAANGVVIITTKSGSYNQNKLNVSVDVSTGFSRATRLPDQLNAQQLGQVFFDSLTNDAIANGTDPTAITHPQFFPTGGAPSVPSSLLGPTVPTTVNGQNGTDFLSEIFEATSTTNTSITLSNGSEKSKFSATLGYLNRGGIQLETGFQRGQARLNSEFKIGDRITVGQHTNVSFNVNSNFTANSTQIALRQNPLVPVFDDNGAFAGTFNNAFGLSNATNPVADLIRSSDDFLKQTRILGDAYLSVDIIDGLTAKTVIGGDLSLLNTRQFLALNPEHSEARGTNTLTEQNQQIYNWTWTNTLNYTKTFDKHNINAIFGYEAIQNTGKSLRVSASGFLFETPDFYLLSNASGAPIVDIPNTFDFESTLFSYFGSANYSYDNTYLFTGTLRRDRSSNFIDDNGTGTFGSASAGWVVSNEDFFPDNGVVNRLKLKGSWGSLGNQTTPRANPGLNIFSLNNSLADFAFDGATATTGAFLNNLGNPDITWETSNTFNVGAEFGLFDNLFDISIEYYNITTNDLIVVNTNIGSDTSSDAGAPVTNTGQVVNKGFDIGISFNKAFSNDFTFGADLNVSTVDNEVTDLPGALIGQEFRNGSITRTEEGQAISSFFGRVADGIYRSEAEVAAGPDQGFANDLAGVGRVRYQDLNGDGVINDDDRTFIGNPHADVIFGLNLRLNYNNWDFSALLSGTLGNDLYNFDKTFTDFATFPNGNRNARVLDAFNATTNPNGSLPANSFIIQNAETSPSSFFVESGSFARLKNLVIGYTFPNQLTDKWGLSSLRLYANASNLFTITGYDGIDPEISPNSGANDATTIGVDENTFPLAQIFLFGVNLKI